MNRFRVTINDDGTVYWHGVDTGKCKVVAMDRKAKLIVLHTAGSYWSDNGGKHYGPARMAVHRYDDSDWHPREIFIHDLFGEIDWHPRSKWTPKEAGI